MGIPRGERLTVTVRLLGEPCLWCWDIVDAEDGTLIESSWATEWTAYVSSREALRAGIMRLADLTRSSRGAPVPGRHAPTGGQKDKLRTFADNDSIEVIRDRRFGERRQRKDSVALDRRRGDRRAGGSATRIES